MLIVLLAYLGGVLTILSPCILPVLPFVFARADQPFRSSGLPMLLGMAVTFAVIASLAAVAGGWAVAANHYGRVAALVLLALFGLTLLLPELADRITRPLVALGARLSQTSGPSSSVAASLLLGVATGLLWAPCAGPILGLILTGAALNGTSIETSLLLLSYAAGAATSLALALVVGGRVFAAMKRSLGVGEWIRRGLGVTVLAAVAAVAFGLDTGLLTTLSARSTAGLEQGLIDGLRPSTASEQPGTVASMQGGAERDGELPVEGKMPSLSGAVTWLNSPPLTAEELKGKVVLVDFWTYSCINCLRTIPYVRAWAEKYRDRGLVVIGVHAPEFAFEKSIDNVRKAVTDLKIGYPVAVDNDFAIWRRFNNAYWPAHYFIDAEGRVRHRHFGEGGYAESEQVIKRLFAEAGQTNVGAGTVTVDLTGTAKAAAEDADISPETYIGYARAENFASPEEPEGDKARFYTPGAPKRGEWGLKGSWTIEAEYAVLAASPGSIVYQYQARDLNLVLGPGPDGKAIRFRVTIDGKPPGGDHGIDVDDAGTGVVTEQRLYQLVRQSDGVGEHTFTIEFLDTGARAYAFTFG
ncbi:cytochrome c biogenesis protein DipZ [Methylobacterium sp. NMS12]|uniref:cytochrome c biogenesis protein DipZ n=1 Tax=Methylobacterium sp. NMS12 TaxID=3079766 RepID=UPI003F8853AE